MSNKQLTILGVIAGVMLLGAILLSHLSNTKTDDPAGVVFLIQGVPVDDIGRINLGAGANTVTLKRIGDNFFVAEKGDYPAQDKLIKKLILDCMGIQTTELITRDAKNHKALGVNTDDENAPEALVRFYRQKENESKEPSLITGVVIGKRSEQGNAQYVRRFDVAEVYLAEGVSLPATAALDYVDKKLTEIKKDDIVKVTVTAPQGNYFIVKDATGKAYLPEIPPGKKVRESDVDQSFAALTSLNFTDVQRESDKTASLKYDVTYQCLLKDMRLYTIRLAQKDDKHYLKCQANYTDNSIQELLNQREKKSDKQIEEGADKLKAHDTAVNFNKTHAPWVYEISSWDAGTLTKKLSDLLEDVEKEEQPENAVENQPVEKNP